MIMKQWSSTKVVDRFKEIETRPCQPSDFARDEGYFYKMAESNESDLEKYAHRLKCIVDMDRDLKMWGNYGTSEAANLVTAFVRCNNSTSSFRCKSDHEIDEFLREKYIMTVQNTKIFV